MKKLLLFLSIFISATAFSQDSLNTKTPLSPVKNNFIIQKSIQFGDTLNQDTSIFRCKVFMPGLLGSVNTNDNQIVLGSNNQLKLRPQGISSVATDGVTVTGNGTVGNPLVAVIPTDTHTVAEMQALAGSFDPNVWYIITDPQSSFGEYRVRARDTSNLEPRGVLIRNDSIILDAGYDLATDLFLYIQDVKQNNIFSVSLDFGTPAVPDFPFNTPNFDDNIGIIASFTIDDNTLVSMQRNYFNMCYGIGINTGGGVNGVSILDSYFGIGSAVDFSGAPSSGLLGCTIGDGISITLVGDNYSNKQISRTESTFDKSRTITTDSLFDFTVSGYNQSFAGQWLVTTAAPKVVTSFTNQSFTHNKTFRLDSGSSTITFVNDGTNIFMKGGIDAVLTNPGDYVTFRFVGNIAYEVDRGIY